MGSKQVELLPGWSVERDTDGAFVIQGPKGGCLARRQGTNAHEDALFDLLEALTAQVAIDSLGQKKPSTPSTEAEPSPACTLEHVREAMANAERVPALSTMTYLERARDGWHEEAVSLQRRLHQAECDIDLLRKHADNDVWHWQGDGYDHLRSMGNRMVVVIHAADLRALVKAGPVDAGISDQVEESAFNTRLRQAVQTWQGATESHDDALRLVYAVETALVGASAPHKAILSYALEEWRSAGNSQGQAHVRSLVGAIESVLGAEAPAIAAVAA